MITENLHLLSDELQTEFTFTVDEYGDMVDLTISENESGVPVPRFTILVDENSKSEKYVLSILESPHTIYFGSNIFETAKVFVSSDIEEVFKRMKEETLSRNKYESES